MKMPLTFNDQGLIFYINKLEAAYLFLQTAEI